MIYTHVMDKGLNRVKSPLDNGDPFKKFGGREETRKSSNILTLTETTSPA